MNRTTAWIITWSSAALIAGAYFVGGMVYARTHPDPTPCTQSAFLAGWKPTKPSGKLKYQCVWFEKPKQEVYCVWEEDNDHAISSNHDDFNLDPGGADMGNPDSLAPELMHHHDTDHHSR